MPRKPRFYQDRRGSRGVGEEELAAALAARGHEFKQQQAIRQPVDGRPRYWFLDFGKWPLAVELKWQTGNPLGDHRRTMHLLKEGWYILYVILNRAGTDQLFEGAASVIIAHAEAIERGDKVPKVADSEVCAGQVAV